MQKLQRTKLELQHNYNMAMCLKVYDSNEYTPGQITIIGEIAYKTDCILSIWFIKPF